MNDKTPSNQEVYYSDNNKQIYAHSMIKYSFRTFMQARHIKELDKLKTSIPQLHTLPTDDELRAFISFLKLDTVIDWTRIIICFENFMKASLLLNGYLIHKIDRNDVNVKSLSNAQNKRPVSLEEYNVIYNYSVAPRDRHHSLKGILDQSITFSTLLRPKYQESINLPKSILETITRINKQRNELHFFHEVKNSYGVGLILELEEMRDFVLNEMMGLYGHLEHVLKEHKK